MGWEYEADQRHAEIIVEALKMGSANGVKTPGEDLKENEEEEDEELGGKSRKKMRKKKMKTGGKHEVPGIGSQSQLLGGRPPRYPVRCQGALPWYGKATADAPAEDEAAGEVPGWQAEDGQQVRMAEGGECHRDLR